MKEAQFGAGLVIQEIMQTKPGRQDDYIRELERLYVPWSESTGKRWLGSFITTFRFNEVIHYWALDGDWDCFENHYPSWKDSPPAEIVTWMSVAPALRDGWEDSISAGPTAVSAAMSSVTRMMQNFSYDPFDPAVMADPPSYYRVLRDEHPVYYIDKWDTYALSRFDDIWQVLGSMTERSSRLREPCPRQRFWQSETTARWPIRRCTHCRSTRTSTPRSTTLCGAARLASSGRSPRPRWPTGSAPWPTSGWTNCCRSARST